METPELVIRRARKAARLRLREVAFATGISVSHLSDIEHQRRVASPERAILIGNAVGIAGDDLNGLVRAAVFARSGLTASQWSKHIVRLAAQPQPHPSQSADMPRLIAALRVAMEALEPFEDDCVGSTIEDDWRHLDGLRTHAIAALARVTAILEGK